MRRALMVCLFAAAPLAAQPRELNIVGPGGVSVPSIAIDFRRGYAAVPLRGLERIGWTLTATARGEGARLGRDTIEVREGTPFFTWGGRLLQLTAAPFRAEGQVWVPLQLVTDFLPAHLPDLYTFRAGQMTLAAAVVSLETAQPPGPQAKPGERPSTAPAVAAGAAAHSGAAAKRVVVIDPGHGGEDPGARGPGGVREKDIALALGLALAKELEKQPDLEVHLTRTDDRLVPLWERGEKATEIKGERAGIFISLHLNAGAALDARGFETYFLSEARTEHERRVAALENEAFEVTARTGATRDQALTGILQELSNLDHQHWSAELAEMVQQDLAPVHPGPNRGVKQGPLAVITNALMPAVLIEVGFISNGSEAKLLSGSDFQEEAAHAIAKSVGRFFEIYPPGV